MIRPATSDDVAGIVALEAEVFGVEAWSTALVEAELVHGRGFVAEGGYALTRLAGDVVDLQRIAVRPDARRGGLATALLDAACAQARADRADRMLLEVSETNEPALAFYAGAGFVEIDRRRRYYRDGSDAVVLRLSWAAGC